MQFLFCFYLIVSISAVLARKLPDFLEPCQKSAKEVGPCIKKNIELIRPRLAAGIPELFIPNLNPFRLPEATLKTSGFEVTFKGIELYKLESVDVKDFQFNTESLKVKISVSFPVVEGTSKYKVKGKVLVLEVDNSGDFYGNFSNVDAHLDGTGKLVTKKGKQYLDISDCAVTVNVGTAFVNFDKLFGDNDELTVNANRIVNENIGTILEDLYPITVSTIGGVILGIANKIFNRYSYEELFP